MLKSLELLIPSLGLISFLLALILLCFLVVWMVTRTVILNAPEAVMIPAAYWAQESKTAIVILSISLYLIASYIVVIVI